LPSYPFLLCHTGFMADAAFAPPQVVVGVLRMAPAMRPCAKAWLSVIFSCGSMLQWWRLQLAAQLDVSVVVDMRSPFNSDDTVCFHLP